jgi:hypothetical protein
MEEIVVTAIVFFGIYQIIKLFSDHFLKRKIINSGHFEKADILGPVVENIEKENRYPSLKWGLIAFMGGLGLIIIETIRVNRPEFINVHDAFMPLGIELVFISAGFLLYFFIANRKNS